MREMNAAKKALADARAHLAELEQRIADPSRGARDAQDIADRYDQIIADQRRAIAAAQRPLRQLKLTVMPVPPKRLSSRASSSK